MTKTITALFLSLSVTLAAQTQSDDDALAIRSIYDKALIDGQCYAWLEHLTTHIGARLAGSPQAAAAVEYAYQMLDSIGLDTVWLQPCWVPHWVRGEREVVRVTQSKMGSFDLNALALGNTIATGVNGIAAEVIEVQGLEEVEHLGNKVAGKIVFYNRPFDNKQINTFSAYGGAADQRYMGPVVAAKHGAVAVIVRSMTGRQDDFPHTGATKAADDETKIVPAVAISTNDANLLSNLLKQEPVKVYIRTSCQMLSKKTSYNVIGEIRGSEHPEEIILVGGHLDAWDVAQGAHDDGAGCVQSMEVLYLLKKMNYRPKRTLRCVLFMNEENGLAGGTAYAAASNEHKEYHLLALESDSGGFSPRGFSTEGDSTIHAAMFKRLNVHAPLLEPYGLTLKFGRGGGADIGPLRSQKGLIMNLNPDSQRYFDYHHSVNDTFDAINERELRLGAGAMTAIVYLVDKYGLR